VEAAKRASDTAKENNNKLIEIQKKFYEAKNKAEEEAA